MGVTTDVLDVTKISKTRNGTREGFEAAIVDVNDFFDRIVAR